MEVLVIGALVFVLSTLFPSCTPQETHPYSAPLQVGQLKVSNYNTSKKLGLGDATLGKGCAAEDWRCLRRSEVASADEKLTRTEVVPIQRNYQHMEKGEAELMTMDYNAPSAHLPINN